MSAYAAILTGILPSIIFINKFYRPASDFLPLISVYSKSTCPEIADRSHQPDRTDSLTLKKTLLDL